MSLNNSDTKNNNKYSLKCKDGTYYIYCDNKVLKTPGGNDVTTIYKEIANRIILDLNKYGYVYNTVDSILSWHFTTIDNFVALDDKTQVMTIYKSFVGKYDWVLDNCPNDPVDGMNWRTLFGKHSKEHYRELINWLAACTTMQRVAAVCVANAYESLSLAYVFAKYVEEIPESKVDKDFKKLAKYIYKFDGNGSIEDYINTFNTFKLYYGIHFKEHGSTVSKFRKIKENN